MDSFGKWWKWKIPITGFLNRVIWVLYKPCESFCLKPSTFRENCINLTFSGCPRKFYHRAMYIAPSSAHISLNFNMPFKLILRSLRRFEAVFWCLEWECCTSFKKLMEVHSNPPTLLWLEVNNDFWGLPYLSIFISFNLYHTYISFEFLWKMTKKCLGWLEWYFVRTLCLLCSQLLLHF